MAKGNKVLAFLGVFFSPVISIIILLASKDAYARYYAKQGLVLAIAFIVLFVGLTITIVGAFLIPILWVLCIIWWIIGLVYSLSGNMKPLPLIGKFAEKLKF